MRLWIVIEHTQFGLHRVANYSSHARHIAHNTPPYMIIGMNTSNHAQDCNQGEAFMTHEKRVESPDFVELAAKDGETLCNSLLDIANHNII